ncbi:hypothetical protein J8I87_05820 [Paraburkholderia sp. LEh10]|uniref:hypothetical protein n=1 Tax=Paraburkholderia sp. LEh10 TaxID=2821353 RepID=UPI001AEB3234|nr:hypothetical protein [Paraburkholderia sp. LEh10]MBP0589241.1 hypothetical protein [Paraburkholderia sp. LEh10]
MATLTIKDISRSEELSAEALSTVRGGANVNAFNTNAAFGGGFASPAIVVAPVTQTDTKVSIPTIANFGGLQGVAL